MTTINSIANLLVNCGLSEAEAFEMAEHDFNIVPTYEELPEYDWDDSWADNDDWELDRYEWDCAPVEYLEDVLARLDCDRNVMVMLNSVSLWFTDRESAPILHNDCCGNHHTINWVESIFSNGFARKFAVLSVVDEGDTVKIYIDAKQGDEGTDELGWGANRHALASLFRT